jgi:secretion/DNA translocation related CpaE-like protein
MTAAAPVLLVTASDGLTAAVMRVAARGGVDLELQRAGQAVRAAWRSSAAVVVGLDLLARISALGLPSRPAVVVIGETEPTVEQWRASVALGAGAVLRLPADEPRLGELIGSVATAARSQAHVLAVTGSCGGAGASTLATAIALVAAAERPTLLVDADPLGGGLDVLLGAEARPGLRWPDVVGLGEIPDLSSRMDQVCRLASLAVLSHGRGDPSAVPATTAERALEWARGAFSLVVVDLPRHRDDAAEVLFESADGLVVVVPATVRAVAAAAVFGRSLVGRDVAGGVAVRDPGGDRLHVHEVEAGLDLPVIATIRSEPTVAAAAIRGEPPVRRRGALIAASRAVLSLLDPPTAAA